jgi:hypothetical protein
MPVHYSGQECVTVAQHRLLYYQVDSFDGRQPPTTVRCTRHPVTQSSLLWNNRVLLIHVE